MIDAIEPSILPRKRGRPKKSTIEQLAECERERSQREMLTVMQNPIRRHFPIPNEPLLSTALGRFCTVHKLKRELHDAADDYAKTRRKIISAWDGPLADQPGGTGGDIPTFLKEEWKRAVSAWETAILESSIEGVAILRWIGVLSFDGGEIPAYVSTRYMIDGLLALAVVQGKLDKKISARS